MRPRYLDRFGIDDRFAAVIVALSIFAGCQIPLPPQPVPPTPEPNPPVIVVPVAGDLFAIVVEETSQRTPEVAAVLLDPFWHTLAARGISYRFYDPDSADAKPYASAVNDRPGLLVIDKSGKKLRAGPLPKTVAEIDAILKGFGK